MVGVRRPGPSVLLLEQGQARGRARRYDSQVAADDNRLPIFWLARYQAPEDTPPKRVASKFLLACEFEPTALEDAAIGVGFDLSCGDLSYLPIPEVGDFPRVDARGPQGLLQLADRGAMQPPR